MNDAKDQIFMGGGKGKGLTELLGNPQARRMLGDVEVQNAPTVMGDDEKTVEHTESDRRHSEEIQFPRKG